MDAPVRVDNTAYGTRGTRTAAADWPGSSPMAGADGLVVGGEKDAAGRSAHAGRGLDGRPKPEQQLRARPPPGVGKHPSPVQLELLTA
jgi:hypothetical protein